MSDPIAHDTFGDTGALHAIFQPTTVAILGATGPNTLGEKALAGLTAGDCDRLVVAIDPRERPNAFGISVCGAIRDVPAAVDLAVVATKSNETLEAIETCVAAGAKGIVVLTGVDGPAERRQEFSRQIRDRLRGTRIKLIGPGGALMNPSINLNVSAGLPMPVAGNVALITQSGSLARALIDWSHKGIVGFSAFVALGDLVDVGWGNLIDYFGNDGTTRAILIHMESIGNMRSFLSAARAVALQKPIIVTKAGRTRAAAQVFSWHRNCTVIDDEVFDAALRRVGVIRVNDVEDLFHVADALSKQPRPKGSRLAIVSNSGATGVLAADQAVAVGTLAPETGEPSERPSESPLSSAGEQPLDVLGDGSSRPFLDAVEKALRDPSNDALLVVLVSQAMSDAATAIHGLLAMPLGSKPALLCLPGPPAVPAEQEVLVRAVLPVFPSIGSAARTFNYMWRYSHDLKAIYETPELHADPADRDLRQRAGSLILHVQQAHRDSLSDDETRDVLAGYGIASLGSDQQRDAAGGYELQIGSCVDPEFGPVVWIDVGGRSFDLMGARVVGLPPLNATLARRMLERSPIFDGLQRLAERNAVNLASIDAALVRLSQLLVEQPAIREVSIDPLKTSAEGTIAGGARIAMYGPEVRDIPKPVFRPYPVHYVSTWTTRQGLTLTIRPIRAEDEPLMIAFHGQLSESAVYLRYFQVVKLARRTAHEALTRVCFGDYDREMVLVAERRGENPADREILAMASLTKLPRRNHGEVAVLVTDHYQRHGIGRELVRRLVNVARDERLDKVVASTMVDNRGMVAVFDRLGFTVSVHDDEVRVELAVRQNG